ncbi:MAG: crossover junction endodeoxyribonuclease RuvC [Pirellulaceae bacterium]|nr:crossover junction endodeoxyribonuclease RuvC [Pirellulaceae bacterium]
MECAERNALVLGIDPGLNTTGYGLIEVSSRGPKLVEAGVVRSRAHDALELKLADIHQGVTELMTTFHPTVMALEKLY